MLWCGGLATNFQAWLLLCLLGFVGGSAKTVVVVGLHVAHPCPRKIQIIHSSRMVIILVSSIKSRMNSFNAHKFKECKNALKGGTGLFN